MPHGTNKASRKKGEAATDDPEPVCRRLLTHDATIEAASDILAKGDPHAKLGLICDELVSFFASFDRYGRRGSAPRSLMLLSFDGGPQHIDRVLRGHVHVGNWSTVVAGNIQTRRLASMAKSLVDDGLFQRTRAPSRSAATTTCRSRLPAATPTAS